MATAAEHYDKVLARHYSKLLGDFDAAVDRQVGILKALGLQGRGVERALDLGAGSGLHTIALTRLGYAVTAVDQNAALLEELKSRTTERSAKTVCADMCPFMAETSERFDAIVCMGDSLPHLDSPSVVDRLLTNCAGRLEAGGRLVLAFRDLTVERKDCDRFIPLYQDADTLMTCFLEYEPETVKVHDLIHERGPDGAWTLVTGFYRKLRLRREAIADTLRALALAVTRDNVDQGLVVIAAQKPAVSS